MSNPALVQPGWRVYEAEKGAHARRYVGEGQSVFYKPSSGKPVVNSVLCTHFMRAGPLVHPVILFLSNKGEWHNALRTHTLYDIEAV